MATTFIPFRWRSEAAKWAATGVVTRAAGDAPPARPGRPATHRWSRTLLLEWRCAVPTGTPAPTGRSTGRRTPTAAVHPTHSNRSFAPLINGTSRSFFPHPRLPLPRNRTFPNGPNSHRKSPIHIKHSSGHPRADQADQPARGVVPRQRRVRGRATAVCCIRPDLARTQPKPSCPDRSTGRCH